MTTDDLSSRLRIALDARTELFDDQHKTAFRAFNGHLEGCPDIVVDVYGSTAVIYDNGEPSETVSRLVEVTGAELRSHLPWLRAIVLKPRRAVDPEERRGRPLYGDLGDVDRRIREHGVWYAVELLLNQDASFYLDTRNLRAWARERLGGKSVLNTFAYTGSLGVAAQAAGARRVVHLDMNRQFLNVAKSSYTLNGFPIRKADFISGDFWIKANALKRKGELFDCVFVDPPFFSTTRGGTVDLVSECHRVINKVRPLVADDGWLVAINNALFVSGAEYVTLLEQLCQDGYLTIEALIPVPPDFTGYPESRVDTEPADPAPFNHSTKIAVLRVRRKDSRPAS
jgi:23S rRNA (cytosine1962-C5)-methyltransferase